MFDSCWEPSPTRPRPDRLPRRYLRGGSGLPLEDHESWLAVERDLTGFTRKEDASAQRLVQWLQSTDDDGSPLVEVRRYTQGFLHGKAYIAEHSVLPRSAGGIIELHLCRVG